MQNCESFYLCESSKTFKKISKYMDGMVNDNSLVDMSDIALLFKLTSLEYEYENYSNNDYFQSHLPKILKQERNTLFQNIFSFIVSSYENQEQQEHSTFEEIFTQYKDDTLTQYLQKFDIFKDFIEIIYLNESCPETENKGKNDKAFGELSDDELSSILCYYQKKIHLYGMLAIESEIEAESYYIREYFMLMIDGYSPDDVKTYIEREKKQFQAEFEKKIEIVRLGLLKYVDKLNILRLSYQTKIDTETTLKSFFDRVTIEGLLKYVTNRTKDSKDNTAQVILQEDVVKEKVDEKILTIKTDTKVYDIYQFDNKTIVVLEENLITVYSEEGVKMKSFEYDSFVAFDNNKISFMFNDTVHIMDENLIYI